MTVPLVVLVSGPPGAGKTTLARPLAAKLGLPLIAKDDIKESLGDSLGWSDLAWSRRLGAATWDLLFLLYERLLESGTSFVAESNFSRSYHIEAFSNLRVRYPFVPVEVYCSIDPVTLADRLRGRQASGERHPVHHGADFEVTATGEAVEAVLRDLGHEPLDLSRHVVRVDTGSSEPVDLDAIVAYIGEARHGSSER